MRIVLRLLFTIGAAAGAFALVRLGLDEAAQWATVAAAVIAVAAWLLPIGIGKGPAARSEDAGKQEISGVKTAGGIRQSSSGTRKRSQVIRWAGAGKDIVQKNESK